MLDPLQPPGFGRRCISPDVPRFESMLLISMKKKKVQVGSCGNFCGNNAEGIERGVDEMAPGDVGLWGCGVVGWWAPGALLGGQGNIPALPTSVCHTSVHCSRPRDHAEFPG